MSAHDEERRYFCILQDADSDASIWLRWITGRHSSFWIIVKDGERLFYKILKQDVENCMTSSSLKCSSGRDNVDLTFTDTIGHFGHGNAFMQTLLGGRRYENLFLDAAASGSVSVDGSTFNIISSPVSVSYSAGCLPQEWQWTHTRASNGVCDSVSGAAFGIWMQSSARLRMESMDISAHVGFGKMMEVSGTEAKFQGSILHLQSAIRIRYPKGISSYTFLRQPLSGGGFFHAEVGGKYDIECAAQIDFPFTST